MLIILKRYYPNETLPLHIPHYTSHNFFVRGVGDVGVKNKTPEISLIIKGVLRPSELQI